VGLKLDNRRQIVDREVRAHSGRHSLDYIHRAAEQPGNAHHTR
jgi:hypothetical protein